MVSEQLTYTIMEKQKESDYTSTYINADFADYEFNQCFSGDYIEGFLDKKTYIKMVDFHLKCKSTLKLF